MPTRRRTYAIAGLLAAGVAATLAYMYRPTTPKQTQQLPRGQTTVVVSALDNHQNLLDLDPNLVLVGTSATKLRDKVAPKDVYRVIETETDSGWAHIVKHMRPDLVVLSHGLTGDAVANFTKRVISMEDFINM